MPSTLGPSPIKQMEGLYPIIRRVRRPLLPEENQVKELLPAPEGEEPSDAKVSRRSL